MFRKGKARGARGTQPRANAFEIATRAPASTFNETVASNERVAAGAVFTARDMAAERCGPAALDRRHHFGLPEAHMPSLRNRQAGSGRGRCPQPPERVGTRGRRYFAGGGSVCGFFGFLR